MLRRALPRVFDHIRRCVCKNEPHRSIIIVVSPLTALIQVSKYGSAGTMADHRHWQREPRVSHWYILYSASSHLTALIKSPADYDCAFHNSRIIRYMTSLGPSLASIVTRRSFPLVGGASGNETTQTLLFSSGMRLSGCAYARVYRRVWGPD